MIDPARYECDVCHRPIGERGYYLPSPRATWGSFAALCPPHATRRARLTAWLQYAWARL